MNAMRPTAVTALLLLAACGSNDGGVNGPTPPVSVPNLSGTYNSTNWLTQFNRTRAFCRKVKELGLLEPMQAQIAMGTGERLSLGGFWAVNRAKLKALPGDKLAELAKTDELELLYVHVQSMRNFNGLRERLVVVEGGKNEPAPAAEAAAKSKAPGTKPAKRAAGD